MPDYRVSYAFTQKTSMHAGWSCNFWNNSATIADAKAEADTLLGKLEDAMGGQARCNFIRVNEPAVKRKVLNDTFPKVAALAVDSTNDTDYPTTAILLELGASETEWTRQWIRGIPDGIISSSGQLQRDNATWSPKWAMFADELRQETNAKHWCIRQMDTAKVERVIESIDLNTGTLTCAENHGLTVDSILKVNVRGIKYPTSMNGIHRVKVVGAKTLKYTPWVVPASTTPEFTNAYVRELAYVLKAIKYINADRSTSHKTGRPMRVLSGRRKTRR